MIKMQVLTPLGARLKYLEMMKVEETNTKYRQLIEHVKEVDWDKVKAEGDEDKRKEEEMG